MAPVIRTPDMVMVVRHGARLDQENHEWHLHSPTPYDSPLCYGGWLQSKALGLRIANLLTVQQAPPTDPSIRFKPKRIILHTSPYLRCIQTAIGIAAGIGQSIPQFYSKPRKDLKRQNSRFRSRHRDVRGSPMLEDVQEELSPLFMIAKPILRVDACLGEWLNPAYFDHITPPPSSQFMVYSAKAELLTEEEIDCYSSSIDPPHFPPEPEEDEIPHIDLNSGLGSLAQALSRHRASSQSRLESQHRQSTSPAPTSFAFLAMGGYYHPPLPTYSVSPIESIPKGYVAHARHACVDVDLHWDSLKDPDFGHGGELGEEWSSMHKRFRSGLSSITDYYSTHSPDIQDPPQPFAADDTECELIVILVTHAAGANALIGGLTNRPVLFDIPQASLTLAARSLETKLPENVTPDSTEVSSLYDMRIRASIEHLRTNASPSSLTSILNVQSRSIANSGITTITTKPFTINPSSGPASPATRPTRSLRSSSTAMQAAPISTSAFATEPRHKDADQPTIITKPDKPGLWSSPKIKPAHSPTVTSPLVLGGGMWSKDAGAQLHKPSQALLQQQQLQQQQLQLLQQQQQQQQPQQQQLQQKPQQQLWSAPVRTTGTVGPVVRALSDDEIPHEGLWKPKRRWTTTEGGNF